MSSKHATDGAALMQSGLLKEALQAFEAGIKADPKDLPSWLGMARVSMSQQNEAQARRAFQAILKLSATHLEAQSTLALLDLRKGDKTALARLKACAAAPEAGFFEQYNLAQVLQDSGDLKGAGQALERANKAAPNNPYVMMELATLALQQGDARTAAETAKKVCTLVPREWFPELVAARALVKLGSLTEALMRLDAASKRFPEQPALAHELFDVAMVQGNFAAAQRAAIDLRRMSPTDANAVYKHALVFFTQGKVADAKPLFEDALRKAPKAIEPKQGLAKCLMLEKKYDDAQKLLEEANALNPTASGPANDLATLLLKKDDGARAVKVLIKVHAAEPEDDATNLNLALGYAQQGLALQAKPHVRAALKSADADIRSQAERLKARVGA